MRLLGEYITVHDDKKFLPGRAVARGTGRRAHLYGAGELPRGGPFTLIIVCIWRGGIGGGGVLRYACADWFRKVVAKETLY